MGIDFSSILLGITVKERPACLNRYFRLGDLEARIINGLSDGFCMMNNYQMLYGLTRGKNTNTSLFADHCSLIPVNNLLYHI